MGAISAFMIEFGVQKLLLIYFPEYYESDAQEIIQSQKKHFNDIRSSINTLRGELTSKEGIETVQNLDFFIAKANKDNQLLTLSLEAIKKENNVLREHLVVKKGVDAGTDLRLHEARAVMIGNYNLAASKNNQKNIGIDGYKRWNPNYQINSVHVSFSSPKGNESKVLSVGESLNFQKNNSEVCTLGFLAETLNGVYDFSLSCKLALKSTKSS